MAQWVKSFPVSTGDAGSIPESGRFLGGGHGNPLKFSCLENPMDRGAWWATGSHKDLDVTEATECTFCLPIYLFL